MPNPMRIGSVPLRVGSVLALGSGCCCGIPCGDCTFETQRQLYLTIDQFTLDGGETCAAGCTGFGVNSKPYAGGPSDPPSGTPLVWYSGFASGDPCEDAPNTIAYDFTCEEGGDIEIHMFSGGISWVHGADCTSLNSECYIVLPTGTQSMGQVQSCDPFYIEAIVPIEVSNPGLSFDQCATGTIRVIIHE